MLSEVKQAHSADGLALRVVETAGIEGATRLTGLPTDAHVWLTNITEDKLHPLETLAGALLLALQPFQVLTVLVEPGDRADS